ncbi:hypothetical protein ACHQM5_018748 [Ranunculus cassubicifolius]
MGRGRGKGKKLTVVAGLDDGSGEETLPAYKRRGRPQKPLKDDIDDEEAEKIEKADIETAKSASLNKENGKTAPVENGKKRKRNGQVKENPVSVKEENGVTTDNTKTNGFRHNGSRRKNTPRRAAEAGVDCK